MATGLRATTTRERKKWKIDSTEARVGGSGGGQQLTDNNLAVPFRGDIGGGMHPGRKLVVVAIVDSHPDKFYVALTCGLRRACVAGVWGRAESDVPFFPFIAGQPFKMEVECLSGGFRVFVDAQKLFDFQHRLAPLHLVDTLWIKGGVTITKLG
ncbi:galectin-related protein-like [Hippocampus comes]|uniref:galectin-related protein-like n=1 Tax=Hippocampus comes TaxID=109280 RepID=UPI00094E51B7|nr:PREDICTED: galectin-related protein-like [Hippocampus comes]